MTGIDVGDKPSLGTQERNLRRVGLCLFLRWFIRLRWLATVGAGLLIAVVQAAGAPFPFAWLYALVAGIAAYNLWFWWRLRPSAVDCEADRLERRFVCVACHHGLAAAQILFDLAALCLLLHFSGGIENPLVLFFLFHVVLSAILLERRGAILVSMLAAGLIWLLALLEGTGVIPHYHPWRQAGLPDLYTLPGFLYGVPAFLSLTVGVLLYLVLSIMSELARRREQIILLGEDLERKNRALERLDQMRQRLLAIASHDLKSPLAAASGLLVTLRDGYLGDMSQPQRGLIERALARLDGLRSLVADILNWTSIQRGELQATMRPTDLGRLLTGTVEQYRERAGAKRIGLATEIPADLPQTLAAPERMAQVFDNLLSNAIKYTPEGGRVTVRAEVSAGLVRFEVIDTGIGIPQDELPQLFSEFWRSTTAKEQGIEGTGLGLSIARRIVAAHHGRIRAASLPGEGSTFTVEIPVRTGGEGIS